MGRAHPPEVRADAVAAVVAGESISHIAKRLGISRKAVIEWRNAAGVGSTRVSPERQETLTDAVFALVRENITALRAIASTALDPGWRRAQPAGELATFAGVLSDKTFRILAAIEAGHTDLEPASHDAPDHPLPPRLDRAAPDDRGPGS